MATYTTEPGPAASASAEPVITSAGLVTVLLGAALPIIDFFIVNVALPPSKPTCTPPAPLWSSWWRRTASRSPCCWSSADGLATRSGAVGCLCSASYCSR
jgi:hypothetical protein